MRSIHDIREKWGKQQNLDRWPMEQVPIETKQLLGCNRQFVFAANSCWRLGELASLVGDILSCLADLLPYWPTSQWN